ncbi:MAG: glycosyltransferase family 2 protein [Anaerolineales bacterium]|nr:glycosyltransferase family 2 protein [Anaerolineales bacterium]
MAVLSIAFWLLALFVLYTYVGYPFLIALLAKVFGKPETYGPYFPAITLMIPAYNEEAYITQKLDNSLTLDYPREKLQILVVADGSSDKTADIVRQYAERSVELSYIPDRNGKMAAIVRAMDFVRGEIVVFSDANNMYEEKALRELVAPFSNGKVGATTGAKLIIEDGRDLSSAEGLYWKYESGVKKNETAMGSTVSSVGEIMAVRKNLFVPPKGKIINDDHYIILDLLRRDYRVVYVPSARSFEYVSKTARDEVERRTRMNAGLYQTISMSGRLLPRRLILIWQVLSHKYFRAFVPFALLSLVILNLIIVLFAREPRGSLILLTHPYGLVALALQFVFYGFAILGNLFTFTGVLGKLFYIPTFLVNSNIATLAGFFSFITNKQSHIWTRVAR